MKRKRGTVRFDHFMEDFPKAIRESAIDQGVWPKDVCPKCKRKFNWHREGSKEKHLRTCPEPKGGRR